MTLDLVMLSCGGRQLRADRVGLLAHDQRPQRTLDLFQPGGIGVGEGLGADERPAQIGADRAAHVADLQREGRLGHLALQVDLGRRLHQTAANADRVDRALPGHRIHVGPGLQLLQHLSGFALVVRRHDTELYGAIAVLEQLANLLVGRAGPLADHVPVEQRLRGSLAEVGHRVGDLGVFVQSHGASFLGNQRVIDQAEHHAIEIEAAARGLGHGAVQPLKQLRGVLHADRLPVDHGQRVGIRRGLGADGRRRSRGRLVRSRRRDQQQNQEEQR